MKSIDDQPATKGDLKRLESKLERKFDTKFDRYRDEVLNKLDAIMAEIEIAREDRINDLLRSKLTEYQTNSSLN